MFTQFVHANKKVVIVLLISLMLLSITVGCSDNASNNTTPSAAPLAQQTRIFTDAQGAKVELPVEINRVIHLWPASTAMHVFFGTDYKIFGTLTGVQSAAWGWLNTISPRLLEINGFAGDATAEELLTLEPDLVITSNNDVAVALRSQGVPIVCMRAGEDLNSFKQMVISMGELLGAEETLKANEYIAFLDNIIDTVQTATSAIPSEERITLYYNSAQHGDSPLLTAGDGSIVDTWMQVVGVNNAMSGLMDGMDKEINIEEILNIDPDYILVGGIHQEKTYNEILTDPAWASLTAVKEGRVIRNPQGVMKWEKTGVEIALQMIWFPQQVYPGVLDIDIEQAVRDFYMNYYGHDLTATEYEDLLAGELSPR